jgi:hypothetical protein
MKKFRYILAIALFLGISFAIFPPAVPQIGTYQFHGAAGNVKILKVRTVNNASLEILFGPTYVSVLEDSFGEGALVEGARKKSLVTDVNFNYTIDYETFFGLGLHQGAWYNTSNWNWTTGTFSTTPDSVGDTVSSFYDPTNLTAVITGFWGQNVTTQNAAAHLAQLPTPVAQYLGAIVWEEKWGNVGNTIVHNAEAGDFAFLFAFQYLVNCTETWTYDTTYGSWIGYKIAVNSTTIYEFSIELPGTAEIPGFELTVLLGVTGCSSIGLIYLVMKKRHN